MSHPINKVSILFVDEYRRKIWPLLVGVTKEEMTEPPSLDELSTHPEYNQVFLTSFFLQYKIFTI